MFNTVNQLTSSMADFSTLEKNATSPVTRQKMHDISIIHKRYRELTADYTDGAGMLAWLIENITKNETVKDAHFYLTGFEHLSIQRAEVVRRIARAAKSFTMGIRRGSELEGILPI
jgi:ATP-dependent helicase/DNAse subunit B